MFDLFLGLPLHPLAVHAFVVLGPLAAVVGVLYAALPRWRAALKWPLLVSALVVGLLGLVTRQSGEALRDRIHPLLETSGPVPGLESVWLHTTLGGVAGLVAIAWALATIVIVWFLLRPVPRGEHRWTVARVIGASVLALASLTALGWIIAAGHSGSVASWGAIAGIA